jgi:putative Holliday junction resolvase
VRYLAIDLGEKRTGLSVGDAQTRVVTPLEVLEISAGADAGKLLVSRLAQVAEEQLGGAGEIVFGLPLNMDGSEGPAAKRVRAIAALVGAATKRAVRFQDERLTSAAADWSMARSGLTRGQKKQRRDALAAAEILRDYLGGLGTPGSLGDG